MEVHHYFIKEKVLQDEVEMRYVKTNDQVVNLFTRTLGTKKFEEFCEQLNINQRIKVGVEGEC